MQAPSQFGRIVIPGGAGLVGQNLVARLVERGYTDLYVIDKHSRNLAALQQLHPEVHVIEADCSKPGDWTDAFEGAQAVVMLQAQIGGLVWDEFVRNNITSTQRVLAAAQHAQVPRLVHISSSVVNSVADDFYTRSKRAQEELVLANPLKQTVVLRPTLMFGWFDRKHLGWLARFMRRVPVFPIPGHGRYMRQPLYAGDFCEVIMACLRDQVTEGCHNISGREKIDYIDIIRTIREVTQARCAIVKIPFELFKMLLTVWALFDRNPPFTTQQLQALVAGDEFEISDWPERFGVSPTPFLQAVQDTFLNARYSHITMEF